MPDLNALLTGIPFIVIGATAAGLYMPVRQTQDTDILVHADDEARIELALRRGGATQTGRLAIGRSSWLLADGARLDVLISNDGWVPGALAAPNRDAAGLPIVRLPYLVLLKIRASRGVDLGDLSRMLGGADEAALADVRRAIAAWQPDAIEDLESIIELGRLELEEPR